MLLTSKIPLANLIELCRVLRHNLSAGLTLRDVFRQQGKRGPVSVRPVAERISAQLDQGDSLQSAVEGERNAFPPLFVALTSVGEETGNLPEIFRELERYYSLQLKLRRQLISQSILPIVQLFTAILVIAFTIFILGIIAASRPGQESPSAIFGLRGSNGALIFLCSSFGTIAVLIISYAILTRALQHKAAFDMLLLRIPVLGTCVEALALGRFALALRLTHESGMPVQRALRLSMEATGNAAFAADAKNVTQALRAGETLTESLSQCRLFPEEFINMVATAEEGGRLSEMMAHQAEYYFEESSRRMTLLTKVLGFVVWATVAGFIIAAIFSIYGNYIGTINKFAG